MPDKALYLLTQFDIDTQDIIAGYYNELKQNNIIGSQTKDIPYHITLGSFSVDREEQLIIDMNKICFEESAIEINLAHLGLFGLNILFIEPNMNYELLQLQHRFFPECGFGYHFWSAHTTILIDEPDAILKALPIIAKRFQPFKARIESVSLYEFFPTRFICENKLKTKTSI